MNRKLFLARVLVSLVLFLNLQAAVFFFIFPQRFVPSFQLSGDTGPFVIQSMGVLFLMWTVPYFFAAINPIKYQVALVQAVIMQIIGVAGESLIYLHLPEKLTILKLSLQRFILFDSAGVLLLITAFLLVRLQNDHE
ncbi:hypothetical protein ADN00_00700 [Ornatilinea apprima]|uniref:Uncharacterized protein n=1 Tax=Ornatilinea apprima TaxID=1134406 RepID=A0A0N8GPJ6_9CHLR|nr:hypothetical protein [Ornatilinea apprima]KPL81082.1 hypothetical protein ADN00_00700 [Ornatilinea apprima]